MPSKQQIERKEQSHKQPPQTQYHTSLSVISLYCFYLFPPQLQVLFGLSITDYRIDLLNPYYIYIKKKICPLQTPHPLRKCLQTLELFLSLYVIPPPISSLQHWRHLGWPLLSLLAVIRAALTWVFRGLDESSGKGLDLMGGGGQWHPNKGCGG